MRESPAGSSRGQEEQQEVSPVSLEERSFREFSPGWSSWLEDYAPKHTSRGGFVETGDRKPGSRNPGGREAGMRKPEGWQLRRLS